MTAIDQPPPVALPADYDPDEVIDDFRLACIARAIDERELTLQKQNKVFFETSGAGHEALGLGLARSLRPSYDWFFPYYRDLALVLGLGVTPYSVLLQAVGSSEDPSSGGRQMPGHYGSHEHNLVSVSSPVATQLLHAVGIALAAKIRKTGQVAMTSMGEGSSNQGDVHEGLNFAAIHKLPFIFVVENNGYAISVPMAKQVAGSSVWERASGYGIPGVVVDGEDVLACYKASRDAVARARAGEGPTLIEAKVTRLTAHSSDDQQTKYRSEEELAAEKGRDALPKFRAQLVDAGILTPDAEERIKAANAHDVDDATDYAESQPDPDPTTTMKWVFTKNWPGETPPPWGMGGGDD